MSTNERPIEVNDRFEDDDPRQGNRVIRIVAVKSMIIGMRYRYRVEVAQFSPHTVGRKRTISARTLRTRYTRISR